MFLILLQIYFYSVHHTDLGIVVLDHLDALELVFKFPMELVHWYDIKFKALHVCW
jgi:hypothetical protein